MMTVPVSADIPKVDIFAATLEVVDLCVTVAIFPKLLHVVESQPNGTPNHVRSPWLAPSALVRPERRSRNDGPLHSAGGAYYHPMHVQRTSYVASTQRRGIRSRQNLTPYQPAHAPNVGVPGPPIGELQGHPGARTTPRHPRRPQTSPIALLRPEIWLLRLL